MRRIMWRTNLTLAARALARNRTYTAINIVGLALGLAACLLIPSYVRFESSYDAWLPDSERVFQVQTVLREAGQPVVETQESPIPVREMLAAGFPTIEQLTVVRSGTTVTRRDGQAVSITVSSADPAFFRIFQLPFVAGSAETALPNVNSIVLTETEAVKHFGSTDILGQTMTLGTGEYRRDYVVSGVLRDLPKNTNLRFGLLFRNDPALADAVPAKYRGWNAMGQMHFVKLRRAADSDDINAELPVWEKRVIAPHFGDGLPGDMAEKLDLKLTPISDVHLGRARAGALAPGGDPRMLATLAIVAVLTAGMAVINFINLSTSQATRRAKEIALRKVLGASRRQIVLQVLAESAMVAGLATILALALVELVAPWLGARIGAELQISYLGSGGVLAPAVLLWLITGLGGGLYPALVLSRFRPAVALRANQSSAETPGSTRLRRALVLAQFATAIGLIACTWVIYTQTHFVQTLDPGYRRDGLIVIETAWRFAGNESEYAAARPGLLAIPGVVATGRTNLSPAATERNLLAVRLPGQSEQLSIGVHAIDAELPRTLGMRLLAGRLLGDAQAKDRLVRPPVQNEEERVATHAQLVARGLNVIVNRATVRALGLVDPAAAIGQTIRVGIDKGALVPCTIVGVVENTRVRTARDAVEPLIFTYDSEGTYLVLVRYVTARPAEVMAGLVRVWRQFEPDLPFKAEYAEALVAEGLAGDRARGALFAAFTATAVLIACLGLYALAAYETERRRKEIGIRKALGARVGDIVRLLAWRFSQPVIAANLIAWPIAWWAMRDWLSHFDARIALGPTPFALAGLIGLSVALATVAGQALRAARLHPVHALRDE